MLDAEEYFHLAIHATQHGLHHSAMEYLHKCLEQEPENAKATFLLAAEHAELGLYKRTITGMQKSISLDDKLEMAYYQLALLYMQQGETKESYPLWQHLSDESGDESLREFAKGMLLLDSMPPQALIHMDRAQELPHPNDFLRHSMASITDSVRNANRSLPEAQTELEPSVHELFVNAYKDSLFNSDEK